MLTVTVGITILKELLRSSLFEATAEQQELWRRISQHRLALSLELQDQYVKYCEEKLGGGYSDLIQTFLAFITASQDMSVMVTPRSKLQKLANDAYLDALLSVCVNTEERILLGDKSKINKHIITKNHIQLLEKTELLNIDDSRNIFTMFTFPISGHQISKDEDSRELGQWIGRILKSQNEFTIYDNYIGTDVNIKNFQKYILKYIPIQSNIMIVTIETDSIKEADLKEEFAKDYYKHWNIEVYVAGNKRESHPRVIVMPEYTICLDKGIQTFGVKGKTESSMITITQSSLMKHYEVKNAKKIYP